MFYTQRLAYMWKKIVIAVILLFAMSSVYADTTEGAIADSTQSNDNYPKISQIENKLYSKSYKNEDIYIRLDRIENTVFRKNFPSDDLATRVDNICDKIKFSTMPGYLLNNIAIIEKANFNRVFKYDNPDSRLERLEYHLVGAVQDGNYQDRVFKLRTLNDQNHVSQYLEEGSFAYNEDYPKLKDRDKSNFSSKLENILYYVAPFLFGLL